MLRGANAPWQRWRSLTTYLQATLNEDKSQHIGTWHYPKGGPPDATEYIVYTREEDDG